MQTASSPKDVPEAGETLLVLDALFGPLQTFLKESIETVSKLHYLFRIGLITVNNVNVCAALAPVAEWGVKGMETEG